MHGNGMPKVLGLIVGLLVLGLVAFVAFQVGAHHAATPAAVDGARYGWHGGGFFFFPFLFFPFGFIFVFLLFRMLFWGAWGGGWAVAVTARATTGARSV